MTPEQKNVVQTITARPSVWRNFTPAGMIALMLGLLILCVIIVAVLRNRRRASAYLAFTLALILLIFNAVYFGINRVRRGWYPVEFSHISYFVMAVSVVLGCKRLLSLAGYCSMLTGLGYILAGVVSPVSLLTTSFSAAELAISVARHQAMWLCGLLILFNMGSFRMCDVWIALTGIALMIGFSLLVYYGLVYPGFDPEERNTMQIIAIVQGNILQYVTHKPLPLFARIATSAGIGLAVVSTVILYHIINVRINASRKKRSERAGTKYANYCVGVLPFLIKVLKYKGVIKSARVGAKRAEYNCEQI